MATRTTGSKGKANGLPKSCEAEAYYALPMSAQRSCIPASYDRTLARACPMRRSQRRD